MYVILLIHITNYDVNCHKNLFIFNQHLFIALAKALFSGRFFTYMLSKQTWNTHNEPTHATNTLAKQHIKFSFHSIHQQPRPDVPDFSFSLHFPQTEKKKEKQKLRCNCDKRKNRINYYISDFVNISIYLWTFSFYVMRRYVTTRRRHRLI